VNKPHSDKVMPLKARVALNCESACIQLLIKQNLEGAIARHCNLKVVPFVLG